MTAERLSSPPPAVAPGVLSVSVIVATRGSARVAECLHAVSAQMPPADELVVVVASGDPRVAVSVGALPGVHLLLRAPADSLTTARRAGAAATARHIIAFLDDDVIVEPGWLERIRAGYIDREVAAVGGRVQEGVDGEAARNAGDIGRLLPNGRLTRNFGADPRKPIEVDHLPAGNLSFRRVAWDAAGGLDTRFPDAGRYAEAALCLRIGHAGGRLLFDPSAVGSTPMPTPRPYGRSDPRVLYRLRRCHMAMLVGVYGRLAPLVRRYAATTLREQRLRLVEAAMLTTPFWGRADGTRRPARRRLDAPLPLGYAVAEIAGMIAGLVIGRRSASPREQT